MTTDKITVTASQSSVTASLTQEIQPAVHNADAETDSARSSDEKISAVIYTEDAKGNEKTFSTDNSIHKRFKSIDDADVKIFEALNQSEATTKNTRWALGIFEEWHVETYGTKAAWDQNSLDPQILAQKLSKFYFSTKPKEIEKRFEVLDASLAHNYHKNTMKNIRAALNRHLSDINSEINIVNDRRFKIPNRVLDGLLKSQMRDGTSRATKHKDIIEVVDLPKIHKYFDNTAHVNPIDLRLYVWYMIALHFVTRGLEFHYQLNLNSFGFALDAKGHEYAYLKHETKHGITTNH
ncbi:hypothetical protein LOTGIDRAFT_155115 [Lottia gigantea]|uniref:DUF3504 domain-containing protein n=1 Tax=Lottia gigantea TaxID=225164 RepID=V3ZSS3_LOTGI|nr:hypothetical protein LOTGIDRAFT_155115 [Lottia gigantea]ESO85625.1 hypothetical protein LOTGIDRAFT_155115 [Lottia gigantea]